MRRARNTLIGAGTALALGLGLGGCGTASRPPETLSATASRTLSYTLEITAKGADVCTRMTVRSTLPGGRQTSQGSYGCGRASLPGHPVLIQSQTSTRSLVADVSPGGCANVQAGSQRTALQPVVSHCSVRSPRFRVTILPPARRLFIAGIPGAPVINFPRHRCATGICITPLA